MNKRLISLLLTVVMIISAVFSSYAGMEDTSSANPALEEIADKGMKAEAAASDDVRVKSSSSDVDTAGCWQKYTGDIEAFAYGLIIRQLECLYDVFPACVELSDGNTVYGIAYTDYKNCYSDADETNCCFESGFIPFNGEISVSQEEFDTGLRIVNLDFTDNQTVFLWTYGSDSFKQHCVVYNQYLQYGVDDGGAVFYESSEYIPGVCEESIGSLYSYDKAKYLLDFDVGTYLGVTGVSLFSQLDYDELEKEINRVIQTQNINFSSVDIVSCVSFSQEAIVSHLLSLQEESFLGYNVEDLVLAAKALDPMECFRITPEGLETLKLKKCVDTTDIAKWLVGMGCAIVTAVAMVGSFVFIECPPLSALADSVAGTAMDIFVQVVISEKELEDIDWRKVALAAASGALSGLLGPYLFAKLGELPYFVLDSALDGFIGSINQIAASWLDGIEGESAFNAMGAGFALAFILSASFKGLSAVVTKAIHTIGPAIKRVAEKCLPALTHKVSMAMQKTGSLIGKMKKAAENSAFHSKYIANKIYEKQMNLILTRNKDEMLDISIKQLSKDNLVDKNGIPITKNAVKELAASAENGADLAYINKNGVTARIIKQNNMVGVAFDSKYQTVQVQGGVTSDRINNFRKAIKAFIDSWKNDASLIPKNVSAYIQNKMDDINPDKVIAIFRETGWTIHENIDLRTVTLVPTEIHESISHMGGVGLKKYMESHVAIEYFDKLVSFAVSSGAIYVQ